MKAKINVMTRKEAAAIRTGLEDPVIRAFVQIIIGTLKHLPSDRARSRVLNCVVDKFREEIESMREEQEPDRCRVCWGTDYHDPACPLHVE